MKSVAPAVLTAAHRFGIVAAAGGRLTGRPALGLPSLATPEREYVVNEFATADGEVIARRVQAGGTVECWLRADLAEQAQARLLAEQAESARLAAAVISWSLGRDEARAAELGLSLEQYRQIRNHSLQRIDQRRGKSSIGM